MEWLSEIPALPLGSSVGAFFALLIWLIKRGDGQTRSVVAELRRQRDEALDREEAAETRAEKLRKAVNVLRGEIVELEDELHMYRRRFGRLEDTETP